MKKKKVLFLGISGRVGPGVLEEYEEHYKKYYEVIIGSRRKYKLKGYKSIQVDYSNIKKLKKAFRGVSVVVNLAANSNENAPFNEIVEPNLIGAYNVFEAARQAKCERVVFASSVYAIKGYPLGYKVKFNEVPKPSGFYGASKVFGESLCYVFSDKYDLSCLAIRIGAYIPNDLKEKVCLVRKNYDYVVSQRDLAQLIHKCIIAPKKVKYGILSGISNNKTKYMDLSFSKKLVGYQPKDDAFKFCKVVKHKKDSTYQKTYGRQTHSA